MCVYSSYVLYDVMSLILIICSLFLYWHQFMMDNLLHSVGIF